MSASPPQPRRNATHAEAPTRSSAALRSVASIAVGVFVVLAGTWLSSSGVFDAGTPSEGTEQAVDSRSRQGDADPADDGFGGGSDAAQTSAESSIAVLGSGNSAFTTTGLAGSLDSDRKPARLIITELGVDAPVEPVGLDEHGRMEIPSSGSRVGWYARGSLPGQDGVAILTSHIDTAAEGPGVLFELQTIEPGAIIEIVDVAGNLSMWVVERSTQQHKDDLPRDLLFDAEGPPRLAVITCAGNFDRNTRSYDDNLIVWARPA